jgi:hypothetical protein
VSNFKYQEREVEKLVSLIARNSYYNLDPKIIQNTYTLLKKTNQKKLNEFFKYQPDVEASKRFKDLIVGTRTSGVEYFHPQLRLNLVTTNSLILLVVILQIII